MGGGHPCSLLTARLGPLFPYLPKQPGYHKRLKAAGPLLAAALDFLAREVPSWHDQVRLIDATPVPCGASRETVKRSELAGWAGYGYCAAELLAHAAGTGALRAGLILTGEFDAGRRPGGGWRVTARFRAEEPSVDVAAGTATVPYPAPS